jgi:predicted DNA-binding protein (MmcQ/YjbR family)
VNLFRRADFEAYVLGMPGTTLVHQWRDDSVAKIGGKIFALFDRDDGEIWFKASDLGFRLLTEQPGIRPAPYFARAGWVAVSPAAGLSQADLVGYIAQARELVLARLSRKARTELGF